MRILILQNDEPWKVVAATSLIKGLKRSYPDAQIEWATPPLTYPLVQYNPRLFETYAGCGPFRAKYDIAINISPSQDASEELARLDASEKRGFTAKDNRVVPVLVEHEDFFEVLTAGARTTKHVLQIFYRLAGLKWHGEGYDLAYYPKNRMKKKKTGIAINDPSLRNFVKDNLVLDYSEKWHVPMRTDILKRIDEINRVKNLITDDLFYVHVGIATHKYVEFLDVFDHNMPIEFFNKGHHYRLNHDER